MAAGLAQHGQTVTVTPPSLRVGTDCSGAEAPIWSMRAMQLVHQHIFSSDIGRAPQLMIAANTKPTVMYKNLVKRRSCEVPAVDLYVAGFPCTPFSMLHNNSKLFKEKAARPLFKILQMLRRSDGPPAAALENVTRILRVKEKSLEAVAERGLRRGDAADGPHTSRRTCGTPKGVLLDGEGSLCHRSGGCHGDGRAVSVVIVEGTVHDFFDIEMSPATTPRG